MKNNTYMKILYYIVASFHIMNFMGCTAIIQPESNHVEFGVVNIAGRWEGRLVQRPYDHWNYVMDLKHMGDSIVGVTHSTKGYNSVTQGLEGVINKDGTFIFKTNRIISQKAAPIYKFCLIEGKLEYTPGEYESLTGEWIGIGGSQCLISGTITLRKRM